MKLSDNGIDAVTIEKMLHQVFRDDWNTQRTVLESTDREVLRTTITFRFEVPMELAREALNTYVGAKPK